MLALFQIIVQFLKIINQKLNKMNIEIEIKNHYGNQLHYATDRDIAIVLSRLTGRKTLTLDDISNLKKLGFTFSVFQPTI